MKDCILTVTLNPAIDKTITVKNFKVGRDFREQALFLSAGGKGINVSRVLHRLRIPTVATGFLGGSDGDYIKKQLNKEGIQHNFCFINENSRTSLTILDPSLNKITRVLERGPRITNKDLERFRKKYIYLLKMCSCVVFSGRNIPGAPDSFYAELITIAKKKNKITLLDTSSKPYEIGLKAKPYMIKPNLKESEQLLGGQLMEFSSIKRAACRLHKRGMKIVAITMGSRGTIVFDGIEMVFAAPPKVKRKSPVGCGDAFIGGFLASYISKKSLQECVRMAVACGAANALSINPGFIKAKNIKEISKQIKI